MAERATRARAGHVLVAGILAWATVGQLAHVTGVARLPYPPASGVIGAPFRHAREAWFDGQPRHELGCEDKDGVFRWVPYDFRLTTRWPGSHHRRIIPYAVLGNSVPYNRLRAEKALIEALCFDDVTRTTVGCRAGSARIGVRTTGLTGERGIHVETECPR